MGRWSPEHSWNRGRTLRLVGDTPQEEAGREKSLLGEGTVLVKDQKGSLLVRNRMEKRSSRGLQ